MTPLRGSLHDTIRCPKAHALGYVDDAAPRLVTRHDPLSKAHALGYVDDAAPRSLHDTIRCPKAHALSYVGGPKAHALGYVDVAAPRLVFHTRSAVPRLTPWAM